VAAVEADVAVARARIFSEVYQILTPDQQTKLKEIQTAMRDRREKRLENRSQHRGPRQP
jgi:Spy/CpxP family protein refolding chaperone